MVICLRMEKTYMAKTPPDNFKVITPENPLLSKQTVTSEVILILYTNLKLNHFPNTKLDLFCSDNLSFQCTAPSTWLTNRCADPSMDLITNLKRMLTAKFFSSSHDEDQETLWSQNPMVYKHSSFFKRNINYGKFCLKSQFA